MTVAWDKGAIIDVSSGTSGTVSFTPTGSAELITTNVRGGTNVSDTLGASDSVNGTYTGIDTANTGDGSDTTGTFYFPNASGSGSTVTATQSQSGHSLRALIDAWTGVATSTPLNDHGINGNSGGGGVTSFTVSTNGTSTNTGDLVVSWFNPASSSTITAGGSDTQVNTDPVAPNTRCSTQWRAAGSGGSQTSTATVGAAAFYAANIGTFKAAGAAVQDAPELDGRPFGLRGQSQMQQLLAY